MSLVMPSLAKAAEKIGLFEGFSAKPYLDSVGVATIGFGTTRYPSGVAVTMKDAHIDKPAALAFLEHDLTDTAINLWKGVKVQPTVNQWSALCSLSYNMGWPSIVKSTLLRLFNVGEVSAASEHFRDWDKARVDGKLVEIRGLLNRRLAEQALFNTPDGIGDG